MRSKCTKAAMLLAAVCVISAIAVSSASAALPEIVPTPTEKTPTTFSGNFEQSIFLESAGESKFVCRGSGISGEFVNSKEARGMKIKFSQCSEHMADFESESLKGTLGYINKATKKVGLRLEPVKGNIFAQPFYAKSKILGKVIGRITPVNEKSGSYNVEYKQYHGKQEVTEFEGALKGEHLEWESEPMGFEVGLKLTLVQPQKGEIKA